MFYSEEAFDKSCAHWDQARKYCFLKITIRHNLIIVLQVYTNFNFSQQMISENSFMGFEDGKKIWLVVKTVQTSKTLCDVTSKFVRIKNNRCQRLNILEYVENLAFPFKNFGSAPQ